MILSKEVYGDMLSYAQFILYSAYEENNVWKKLPICFKSFCNVSVTDQKSWCTYEQACSALEKTKVSINNDIIYGIGFCLTENDPFFLLDIDKCKEEGGWSSVALELCDQFYGAAIETSVSGTGIHILGKGNPNTKKCKDTKNNLELYTKDRFIALTGKDAFGCANKDCSDDLDWFVDKYTAFKDSFIEKSKEEKDQENTAEISTSTTMDDEEIIKKARSSRSVKSIFGEVSATFEDLWTANEDVLSKIYPSIIHKYDRSSADIALAQHLAFWTGKDKERIKQIMMKSALVREKWKREDYIQTTINNACINTTRVYKKTGKLKEIAKNSSMVFLTFEQQIKMFKDCVYISDEHVIMTKKGQKLKKEQFEATYGGYEFLMDVEGIKRTTDNAFKAFTKFNGYKFPRADSTCFLPKEEPGKLIERNDLTLYNTYKEINIKRIQGNPSPFVNHLRKMFPNDKDCMLLISYCASIVQNKGVKFKYAVFLQGVEGNGKSLLVNCICKAVGKQYTHSPSASILVEKYNEWLYGNIFIPVQDLLIDSRDQTQVFETLKPWITDEHIEIRYPGGFRVMREICCNFLFVSNSQTGINKTANDRRIMPLYCAQQKREDLARDGMSNEYFTNLYNWLENEDGYEIVTEYLSTYEIPASMDPAKKKPAPITSFTDSAICNSYGIAEQEIIERIERDDVGFRDGWISSFYLDRLLTDLRLSRVIPINKRKEMLQTMGYQQHPGLKHGRLNNPTHPDGMKPVLYIKNGHRFAQLTGSSEIAHEYRVAQIAANIY